MTIDSEAPVSDELTFGALFAIVSRYARLIAITAVIAMVIAVLLVVKEPRTFSTSMTFMTKQGGGSSGGLAAQLGLSMGGGDIMQSSPFYVELAETDAILGEVVDSARVQTSAGTQSLAQALRMNTSQPNWRLSAMGALRKMISLSVAPRTQIISLYVSGPTPDVAMAVSNAVVAALVRFNLEVRQSTAAAERRFIEARRVDVRADLNGVEARYQEFLRRNRGGLASPEIDFERQRLLTEVELRRQMYSTLSQAYERARMDEVRDSPVITIIDVPVRPLGPDPRPLLRTSVLAVFGGALAGVVLAFLIESLKRAGLLPTWAQRFTTGIAPVR